jgi:polyphosphate kinase
MDDPNSTTSSGPASSSAEIRGNGQPARRRSRRNPRTAVTPPNPVDDLPGGANFLNRDLSWLEFNRRVLHEAMDDRTPLLERVRFLGIFSSNLDEFVMKRIGMLRTRTAAGKQQLPDGANPARVLASVREVVVELEQKRWDCFRSLEPGLAALGVQLVPWDQLREDEKSYCATYFQQNVFPILTPLAVDPGHPFPFISNLSESIGVVLHHPDRSENLFARIKVPESLPRWIPLPSPADSRQMRFVSLCGVIRKHLQDLFVGMLVVDSMLFRITRSTEPELEEEEAEDIREFVAEELRQRRFARVVRLEHGPDPNVWMLQILKEELSLGDEDVYQTPGGLEYLDLKQIASLDFPAMRFEPWVPTVPAPLAEEDADIFSIIRGGDLLIQHPYESFHDSVERFVTTAATDPKVLAIKMTLYRTGEDSPFIRSLIQAAERHKQVVALVEVKARFDEERNIQLAQQLEKAGVHVVYGVVGLKTHTKTALVVRQDVDRIRCYAHIGTGNYHTQTARLYTDLGLFTCDPLITDELVELFHQLTGRSLKQNYGRLLVAPANMRPRFLELIQNETDNAKAGKPAGIVAKMNSLEDRKIITALYQASQAGVPIDLIVRGFCCLRPGVPGMSERIRVTSVIGRFLEHSRIFHFRNGAESPVDGLCYIGSADWMYRNLLARVEAATPILDRQLRSECWDILQILLHDQRQAWDMRSDGTYVQRKPAAGSGEVGTHELFMRLARQRNAIPQ